MKHLNLLKSTLLLCALVAGSTSVWAQKTYKKISSSSELVSGCNYLIVSAEYSNASDPVVPASYYTIGAVAQNNRIGVAVTIASDCITTTVATTSGSSNAHEIQFIKSGSVWHLYDVANEKYLNGGYGKKNGVKSNNNHLKTEDEVATTDGKSRDGNWTISIGEGGVATIQNTNVFYLRFNPNLQGSTGSKTFNPLFASYTEESFTDIYLYREVTPATITTAEYATFCSPYATDFSTTGVTVYTATAGETSVTLNEVASGKVPANTPVVLYKAGADGTAINVPVIASADAVGSNDLKVSVGGEPTNAYVLANKTSGVGFYKWAGGSLTSGKIYLQGASSAREFLGFGDVTGIESLTPSPSPKGEGSEYYNLAGQRVAQPTKGLYIVNGRKVVIK